MDTRLNLLVVEDHDDLRAATVAALTKLGYAVLGVASAEAIDDELGRFRPDVLLLDLNLPGEDGLSVARRMRAAVPNIGIVMITARNRAQDVMAGYDSGADIYVAKPVSPEEVHAAIQALARRLRPRERTESSLALDTQTLSIAGPLGSANISDGDCQLLIALAQANTQRLETWQLLERLDKPVSEVEKRNLTVQITRLRKKLSDVGAPEPTLKAIRGTGYQLCIALTIESA